MQIPLFLALLFGNCPLIFKHTCSFSKHSILFSRLTNLLIDWLIDWLTVRLTEAYSAPYVTLHIHNLAIFWALAYLEPEAYLKPCEMLMRHIQNPAIGHCSAIFRHIQNLAQHLQLQKPGILGILEYSVPFHNCIPTHIQNPVIFTKIYECSELWDI